MASRGRVPARWRRVSVYAAFLIGVLVSLWVPLYNRVDPSIAGIPFFYWFQILWIVVLAVVTAIAYRLGI
jgi:hypothetical protein